MASEQTDTTDHKSEPSIYDQLVSASPDLIDPGQFQQPINAISESIRNAKDEEREAKILLYLSVAGVVAGIAVGWIGATRRR